MPLLLVAVFAVAPFRARDLAVLVVLLSMGILQASAQTTLFSETFDESNGLTAGSSAEGIAWSGTWSVAAGELESGDSNNTPSYWTIDPVSVSVSGTVTFQAVLDVVNLGNGSASCLVELQMAENGGAWTTIFTRNSSSIGTDLFPDESRSVSAGTIQFRWLASTKKRGANLDDCVITFLPDATADGCTDSDACNFDVAANSDDGTCIYATDCDYCSGETDGTGTIVDGSSLTPFGFTLTVDNFPEEVAWYMVDDDASTTLIWGTGGSTSNPTELSASEVGDGESLVYEQCFDPSGSYSLFISDTYGDGLLGTSSGGTPGWTLVVGSGVGTTVSNVVAPIDINVEDPFEISIDFGCTDSGASNYDAAANVDNGTCNYGGCTDASACNYDPAAITDDGSCILLGSGAACCVLDTSQSSTLAGEEGDTLQFTGTGDLKTLYLDLNWVDLAPGGNERPADLLIAITDPNGTCESIGGAGFNPGDCFLNGLGSAIYAADWLSPAGTAGSFVDTLDLSGYGFSGTGVWTVAIYNARAGAGDVVYNLNWSMDFFCADPPPVLGCTAPSACNYQASATEDDGTCFYAAPGEDCNCAVEETWSDTLAGFEQGQPLFIEANSASGPGVVNLSLDMVNLSSPLNENAWVSDLAIRILAPDSSCAWFGGFDIQASDIPECTSADSLGLNWPASWYSWEDGTYQAQVDLSSSGLSGSGTWSATLFNGWSGLVNVEGQIEQTDNTLAFAMSWTVNGLCAKGCTDSTACNYVPEAVVDDGSCTYAFLPELNALDTVFELELDTMGVVFLDDIWGQLGLSNDCGGFTYAFVENGCQVLGQGMPSYDSTGVYALDLTVSDADVSLPLSVDVVVTTAVLSGCRDFAACNFNRPDLGADCIYPGEMGWCEDPSNGVGFKLAPVANGDSCSCASDPFDVLFFENFDAGGEVDLNAQTVLTTGIGYTGFNPLNGESVDTYNALDFAPFWTVSVDGSTIDNGELDGTPDEPFYWYTQTGGTGTGLYFEGYWLEAQARWTSREVQTSGLTWLGIESRFSQIGGESADYISAEILDFANQTSLSSVELGAGVSNGVWVERSATVMASVPSAQLMVRAMNDASGEYHAFDDVKLLGWGRPGCTDPRATVASFDATAHVEDGSCLFDQDTLFACHSGLHTEKLWGTEQVITPNRLGGFAQVPDSTTSVVIGSRCQVVLDTAGANGILHVNDLVVEADGAFYLPAGSELHVHGVYRPKGAKGVHGPGAFHVHGDWDWTEQEGTDRLSLGDVVLADGASLVVPEGKVLGISGNLTFPSDGMGTVSGTVCMEGQGAQVISGGTAQFDGLQVDKCNSTEPVVFETDIEVSGRLCCLKGVLDLGTDSLKFRSNALGTGMMDAIPEGAAILGSGTGLTQVAAKVERYVAPDADGVTFSGYTLYAAPMNGLTVSALADIEGFYLAGFPGTDWPNSFSTVLFWDEAHSAFVEPANLQTPLDTLGGAWLAIAGSQTPTLTTRGWLQSHASTEEWSRDLTRSDTATATPEYAGWNLVQNPYQAQLDWHAIRDINPGVEDQFAIYDTQQKQFQRYSEFTLAPAQINGNRYIQPGNSFWVRVHPDSSETTFRLPPSVIDNAASAGAFVRSYEEQGGDILLSCENAYGTGHLFLRVSELGSESYLHGKDATFLTSSSVRAGQLAVQTGGMDFVSKALPPQFQAPLRVLAKSNMATTIRVLQAPEGFCGQVMDVSTGQVMPLTVGDSLTFTLETNEADSGRFMLSWSPWVETTGRMPSCPEALDGKIEVNLGPGHVAHVALIAENGALMEQAMNAEDTVMWDAAPGAYSVIVTSASGQGCPKVQRQVLVPEGEMPELLGLQVEPAPCDSGWGTVSFELYGGGVFGWTLSNGTGAQLQGTGYAAEHNVSSLSPGEYVLDIDHACLSTTEDVMLLDPDVPEVEWASNGPILVMEEGGSVALEIECWTSADSVVWRLDEAVVATGSSLTLPFEEPGAGFVELEVMGSTCSWTEQIPYEVVMSQRASVEWGVEVIQHDGQWWIHGPEWEQPIHWSLFDVRGRVVRQGHSGEFPFSLATPTTAGGYLLVLHSGPFKSVFSLLAPH